MITILEYFMQLILFHRKKELLKYIAYLLEIPT